MTRDDIIRMAREAKCAIWEDGSVSPALERFAALVAAAEREECAKVCDSFYESWVGIHGRYEFMGEGAQECAAAIRARGAP